jgi:Domain of unknown function (DUF4136)
MGQSIFETYKIVVFLNESEVNKPYMKRILVVLLTVVVASCSSVKTSFDIDKTVDFTKFKTYGYAEDVAKLPLQELDRNRIIGAVDKELAARGFSKSSSPDVWIDLMITAEKKQTATATNTGPGMYGYGRPYMYGGGFSTTQINVESYIDGTLFVNMIADNKLVWQGRGTKTIDQDASAEKKDKNIAYAVGLIFNQFPIKVPAKK